MQSFLYTYVIAVGSVILFLYGFFPLQKALSNGNVLPPKLLKDIELNATDLYKQVVDRLVLIVIDALRLDFVTLKHMPFLVSSYKQDGCFLTVKVESPTVTLPRIKSLTTGSIPQFADIIFNLAGTDKHSNSFLHAAAEANKFVIFHGDDTWVKLYSETFKRFEGFSTYFVSDFNEVDSNITRNIKSELKNEDWDIMVTHYPGIDHIGHMQGPFSDLIHPKLQEMDEIIKELFLASKTWNKRTLIAVTGDHGMKNSGGHGGATFEEAHTPLVLLGIPCYNSLIMQSDIPTTLSALLGLKLPASGTGRVVDSVLENVAHNRLLYVLRYNAIVLLNRHEGDRHLFNLATDFHYDYLKTNNENDSLKAKKLYEKYIRNISEYLIRSSVKQDEFILLLSGSVLINCLSIIVYLLIINRSRRTLEIFLLAFVAIVHPFLPSTYFLRELLLCVISVYSFFNIKTTAKLLIHWICSNCVNFIIILTLIHTISLTSSSFIEEEHQVWYFLYGTFLMVQCYNNVFQSKFLHWLLLFIMLRFIRTLNQTGDKWAHLSDVTDWLLLVENSAYLKILQVISLTLIWILNDRNSSSITLIVIYIFHLIGGTWSAVLGKTAWLCIIITFCYNLLKRTKYLKSIVQTWVLICALLLQPYNTILLPACIYTSRLICQNLSYDFISLILLHIWLGKVFFFCQGHSNSLASIEISSGYVGLNEYNVFVTTVQVLCHTYSFPILTTLLTLNIPSIDYDAFWLYNAGFQLLTTVITCTVLFIQRHHLFIWTVFAPKLVFEFFHLAVLLLQMVIFYFLYSSKYDTKN